MTVTDTTGGVAKGSVCQVTVEIEYVLFIPYKVACVSDNEPGTADNDVFVSGY